MTDAQCTLTVAIPALRQALLAVVAHAAPIRLGDTDLKLSRVRLIAGKNELLLAATCETTTALAAIRIDEDSRTIRFAADDGAFVVDLHPAKARDIARQIKPTKDDEQPGTCELHITTSTITATDVSGLWPDTALTVPLLATDADFPDVPAQLGRAIAAASGQFKPLVTPGMPAFDVAVREYDLPLMVEPTGTAESRGFLVMCGPDFLGTVSSRHNDDGNASRRDKAKHAHMARLGVDRALKAV